MGSDSLGATITASRRFCTRTRVIPIRGHAPCPTPPRVLSGLPIAIFEKEGIPVANELNT